MQLVLYGYVRGAPLRTGARVHLAGAGDFVLQVARLVNINHGAAAGLAGSHALPGLTAVPVPLTSASWVALCRRLMPCLTHALRQMPGPSGVVSTVKDAPWLANPRMLTTESCPTRRTPLILPQPLTVAWHAERDRLLYAPMADVGGLLWDKDAVYVDIPDWKASGCATPTNALLRLCELPVWTEACTQ